MATKNANSEILKFQDLNAGDRYIVKGFKEVNEKLEPSFILHVIQNEDATPVKVWSTKTINEYIEREVGANPKRFEFTVRKITEGKYEGKLWADIYGFNTYSLDIGCVWL